VCVLRYDDNLNPSLERRTRYRPDEFIDVIHPIWSQTPVFIGAMTQALSLYLDALRFGAAFTVFVSHWAGARYSGGQFWRVMGYGRTSVIVFFVLSGFVIAWVTETRERTLEDYAFSRIARLCSVIVPAFLLTAVLDRLGIAIDPQLYGPELSLSPTERFLGYAISAVFLGESWSLAMLPGGNVPFWSLNYEAWYYVLFGAALFLRGRRRTIAVVAAALLAGPKILLLLPIWLMGLVAWRWRAALSPRQAAPLAFAVVAAFAALEVLGGRQLFDEAATPWLAFGYSAYDYVVGAFVAVFILALANIPLRLPGYREHRLIRWLAGTSFGLYLYHYPLLNFFGTVVPGSPDEAMHGLLVFGLTLGVALPLARLTEQWKNPMKRTLHSGFDAARRKYRDPATGGRGLS
jgi:peptidoglycan/LPS O-acetylase OafA/YrhL